MGGYRHLAPSEHPNESWLRSSYIFLVLLTTESENSLTLKVALFRAEQGSERVTRERGKY